MNKSNLMLHCGAEGKKTRDEISGVLLPPITDTYCPIGHLTLLELVEKSLGEIGFRFGEEAHGMTRDGDRYLGLVELLNGTDNEQHALVMGLRNSLDKSFGAGVSFGSMVFVCDNLAFSGERVLGRKHTPNILRDLPALVLAAVSQTKAMQHNQDLRFERYQEVSLSSYRADHLILQMLRTGVINTTRVQKVVEQWDEPDHDFGGRTAWRLFNATTEALKGVSLEKMPARTLQLQAILDDVTSFVPTVAVAA